MPKCTNPFFDWAQEAWFTEDQTRREAITRDLCSAFHYAYGRMDGGQSPIVAIEPGAAKSKLDTAHQFAALYAAMRDDDRALRRLYVFSLHQAWENFTELAGRSIEWPAQVNGEPNEWDRVVERVATDTEPAR